MTNTQAKKLRWRQARIVSLRGLKPGAKRFWSRGMIVKARTRGDNVLVLHGPFGKPAVVPAHVVEFM